MGVEVAAAAAAEVGVEEAAVEVGAAAGAQELGLAASVDGDGDDAFSGPSQCAPSFLTWEPSLFQSLHCQRSWIRWCSPTQRMRIPSSWKNQQSRQLFQLEVSFSSANRR